jgi:hypothetical protein
MGRKTVAVSGSKAPNPSGKVIFYGARKRKCTRNLSERQIQDEEVKTSAQGSEKKANVQRRRSSSIRIPSPITFLDDQPGTTSIAQTNPFPLSIPPTQDFHDSPPSSSIMRPDSPSNLRHHAGATAQILLPLLKDACDLFHQVPYVKVVAGLVQEIIKISEVCVTF